MSLNITRMNSFQASYNNFRKIGFGDDGEFINKGPMPYYKTPKPERTTISEERYHNTPKYDKSKDKSTDAKSGTEGSGIVKERLDALERTVKQQSRKIDLLESDLGFREKAGLPVPARLRRLERVVKLQGDLNYAFVDGLRKLDYECDADDSIDTADRYSSSIGGITDQI